MTLPARPQATTEAIASQRPAGDRRLPAPSVDEVWQLLGRADLIMRALIEAPDRAARQRCQGRAEAWLRDVNQAWVRNPATRPPDVGASGDS